MQPNLRKLIDNKKVADVHIHISTKKSKETKKKTKSTSHLSTQSLETKSLECIYWSQMLDASYGDAQLPLLWLTSLSRILCFGDSKEKKNNCSTRNSAVHLPAWLEFRKHLDITDVLTHHKCSCCLSVSVYLYQFISISYKNS